jgi:SAM-dependent methyltransferase
VRQRIVARNLSLDGDLPYTDSTFSVVLDLYVSCHFLDLRRRDRYWNELHRVLRPNGYALAAFFSIHDEYYRRFLDVADPIDGTTVRDPLNGIAKRLYTADELRVVFKPLFSEVEVCEVQFEDSVQGQRYRRCVLGLRLLKHGS